MNFLHLAILFAVLFAAELLYFRIADRYNIIDKPNARSSHDYITIRGGGIVFWLAALLFVVFHSQFSIFNFQFLSGITLISAVSFIDDIKSLPNKIRIIIHFTAISCVFFGLGIFGTLNGWLILFAYIFFVGILNAYNFMDGINGITGSYSLIVLMSLQYLNLKKIPFTTSDFINYAILACLVFLFFNFRKKAKCFAGDVGSMATSFWIVTLLLQLMLKTNNIIWIMFLAVYGVDTTLTILHRLYLKQNIFKAHRMHFYQILANEKHLSHQFVSTLYAVTQLLICGIIIAIHFTYPQYEIVAAITILLVLSLVYLLKFKYLKKIFPHNLYNSNT